MNERTETARGNEREPAPLRSRLGLRTWFAGYLLWMIGLTVAARWSLETAGNGAPLGQAVWLLAVFAFYLSLCCVFFPAPTTWIVLFAASNQAAAEAGVEEWSAARIVVVATIGALSTGLANLNEYHILTYVLGLPRVARVRGTRAYRAAAGWFGVSPFMALAAIGIVPIPVDVVRWLAISERYSRPRFFLAYFVGRWIRYAGLGVAALGLGLTRGHIVGIQAGLIFFAVLRFVLPRVRRRRIESAPAASPVPAAVPIPEPRPDGEPAYLPMQNREKIRPSSSSAASSPVSAARRSAAS